MVNALMPIGELARRARVPVKTLRQYSDLGIVPPAEHTTSGYQMYGEQAWLRLETIKALRRLGFELEEISGLLVRRDERSGMRAQLRAVRSRLRDLRHVATVLQGALDRRHEPPTVHLARLETLARIAADEHAGPVAGTDDGRWEPALPILPDDAEPGQVDAWLELAALLADEATRPQLEETAAPAAPGGAAPETDVLAVLQDAMEARAAGVTPDDPDADLLVERLLEAYAGVFGDGDDVGERLLEQVARAGDLRSRRYWRLVARINGWPEQSPQTQAMDWLVAAVRARCG